MSSYPSWITARPLTRNWNAMRNGKTSRVCSVKAIAIHYIEVPGQSADECWKFFEGKEESGGTNDINNAEQGATGCGAHFIVDANKILALAPDPSYVFYHVGDEISRDANASAWNKDTTKFVRGAANYYTIGIEHTHPDNDGKFTPEVLKKSHQLVRWLKEKYGSHILIGRHYDFSGKGCPKWYCPIIKGKNDFGVIKGPDGKLVRKTFRYPEGSTEAEEVILKNYRWMLLLQYYKQSDANAIPGDLS